MDSLFVFLILLLLSGPVALIWAIILTRRIHLLEMKQTLLNRRFAGRESSPPEPDPVLPRPERALSAAREREEADGGRDEERLVPAGVELSAPAEKEPPAPTGDDLPAPTGDDLPAPAGDDLPVPTLDDLPAPVGDGKSSFERFIGMRALNWAGVVTILFGVASALKVAWSRGWLGDSGMCILVYTLALLLAGAGHLLRRRSFGLVAEGVSALGFGVLFAASFCARHLLGILSNETAFAVMVATTISGALLAARYRSQVLAGLIFLGGYLTPVLLATGDDHGEFLISYLALLGCAAAVFNYAYRWAFVKLLGFAATWFVFLGWYAEFGDGRTGVALTATAAFFLLHSLAPVLPLLRSRRPSDAGDVVAVLGNAVFCSLFLCDIIDREHSLHLALATFGLSLYFLVQYLVFRRRGLEQSPVGMTNLILAIGFFTAAVPIDMGRVAMTMTWAVEGLFLLALGLSTRRALLLGAGAVSLALSLEELVRRLPLHEGPFTPVFNGPFFSWIVVASACGLGAAWWGGRAFCRSEPYPAPAVKRLFSSIFAIAAGGALAFACSAEIVAHVDTNRDLPIRRALPWIWIVGAILSAAYTFLAARFRRAPFTYAGLAFYSVTLVSFLVSVMVYHEPGFRPFLNPCFLCALALGAAGMVNARLQAATDGSNREIFMLAFAMAAGAMIWIAPVNEVHALCKYDPLLSEKNVIPYVWLFGIGPVLLLSVAATRCRGFRENERRLLACVAIACLAFVLVIFGFSCFLCRETAFTPVLNPSFLCGLALAASCAGAALLLPRTAGAGALPWLWGAFIAALFQLLSVEAYQYLAFHPALEDAGKLWALASLSALWAIFGAGLLVAGVARRVAPLRYAALALFGVTLGKVFLLDTASLEPIYRIIGFLTLGAVLVAGSFAYSKFLRGRNGETT